MIVGIYIVAVVMFCGAFQFSKILETTYRILQIAKESSAVVMDKSLDDHAKEVQVQKAAINMLKAGFWFTLKAALCLAAAIAPLWLADLLGWATLADTSAFALRLDVLVITTLAVMALVMVARKLFKRHS